MNNHLEHNDVVIGWVAKDSEEEAKQAFPTAVISRIQRLKHSREIRRAQEAPKIQQPL